jgi:hypothetical protein
MNKLLLCTDLDRTLIPNGPQPESKLARKKFNQFISNENVTLVYVTGRDQLLVKQAIKNYKIPEPDFVIADVGANIYHIVNNNWIHLDQWDADISHDWNGQSNKDLKKLLSHFKDIRIQDYSKQKKHKLSYFVPLYINQASLLKEIEMCLEQENVKANLIWSVDDSASIGLLDILSANKKHAIEFLMKEYDFSLDETIFAGDSGNDISVMISPIQSILVANATADVKEMARKQASINNETDSLYLAKGGFLGLNGNYSAGILEGVVHYMPGVERFITLTDNGSTS